MCIIFSKILEKTETIDMGLYLLIFVFSPDLYNSMTLLFLICLEKHLLSLIDLESKLTVLCKHQYIVYLSMQEGYTSL